ncbi:MAG: HIT family protein [Acidimicrobiia bacterium]|nr:HIT family protein [Acidimicrobiia bacterium]
MATLFTRIIDGELPGRFVWHDDIAVAFLALHPLATGHTLVVPRLEVDQWTDLPTEVAAHLMLVAHHIGVAQKTAFSPTRVGLIIAGFEVPHTHVHVFGADHMGTFDFANASVEAEPPGMDDVAESLRAELRAAGHGARVAD